MYPSTNEWYFAFDNAPLAQPLQDRMHNLLKAVPDTNLNTDTIRFVKNFFTADGYPHVAPEAKTYEMSYPYIFPAIAPWYDMAAIPATVTEMDPTFRQTACEAALSWLFTTTNATGMPVFGENSRTFHGVAFREEVQGVTHTFAFPDTRIASPAIDGTAAVVLIADSYWNNSDWEKAGSVPLYARQQAMFQLWCWEQFAIHLPANSGFAGKIPSTAFIVRICGNLPTDCTIRRVDYDPKEANALIKRICKARNMEPQNGLYWKRNLQSFQTWKEKIENEAYIAENDNLHTLVVEYMKARSTRKAIARELESVTDRMAAIAVELANRIPAGDLQGKLEASDGTIYTVTHQLRRSSRRTPFSTDVLRSFFPHLDDYIVAPGSERTTVTIDVL